MSASHSSGGTATSAVLPCYKQVGIWGDRSCPELKTYAHCHHCPVFSEHADQLLDRPLPPDYARQWTLRLQQPAEQTQEQTRSMLVFRVAQEWLAIDVSLVKEVAPAGSIHAVPHRSGGQIPGFLGLINIRGSLELAVCLQTLLGITQANQPTADMTATNPQQRLLVAEQRQQRWVFPADQVDGVYHLTSEQFTTPPATVQRAGGSLTAHVVHLEDRSAGCLDTNKLLAALNRMFQA